MTALQEIAKQIAALESQMAELQNALREIRPREVRVMAEPDIWERIRQVYLTPFEKLDCGPEYGWSMKDGEPELRVPQKGECYLMTRHLEPSRCLAPARHDSRLILIPIEPKPDVYEQIRQHYGKPFSDIDCAYRCGDDEYFPLMEGAHPVFRWSAVQEPYLGGKNVYVGPFDFPRLILRPAKVIGPFTEDPEGRFVEMMNGEMYIHSPDCGAHLTRYRREEQA